VSARWLTLAPALLLAAQLPLGAGSEVHGERDVFAGPGVALVWAVLRAPFDEATEVVIRVVLTATADGPSPYAYVRLYGIDPFGGERRVLTPGGLLSGTTELRTPRATFAEFPRRELRLYRTLEAWSADAPALTIYYLGVPDTTPEFLSEPALKAYLDGAASRAGALSPSAR
jgi:hypothetical protein